MERGGGWVGSGGFFGGELEFFDGEVEDFGFFGVGDGDFEAGVLEGFAGLGDVSEDGDDVAGDGFVVVVFGEVEVQGVVELVDVEAGVEGGGLLVGCDGDGGVVGLLFVFVVYFADDFFEDVFDGDEACGAAVLVEDDGEVDFGGAELGEEVADGLGFGDDEGFADDVVEVEVLAVVEEVR